MISPEVSVVMGVFNNAAGLINSLDSVLAQKGVDLELIVVDDGSTDDTSAILGRKAGQDTRLHVLHQNNCGITHALARGCRRALGPYIARLDVGDSMEPNRLARQLLAIKADQECVLATSFVEICGPNWEHLWVNRGTVTLAGVPSRVDHVPATQGIAMDIPHHSSVMMSRSAYEAVGGYRTAFYFGQDWDLWYRLANVGKFVHLPEVLTRVRLFSNGLSSRHWREQKEIAKLSLACHVARSRGQPETMLLNQAAAILPRPNTLTLFPWDGLRAEGAYFIGEALRRKRDRRCRRFFIEALCHGFWKPKVWCRSIQSSIL